MAIHFLLGPAGADRSGELRRRLIASADANPGLRHIMLVPEQFTMQTQRDIVEAHPRHAVTNIDILSFERLAYRIFSDQGGQTPQILSETGKMMLLRRAAGQHREQLGVFKRSLKRPGFVSHLMTMLSEFYQYGITEKDIEELAGKMEAHPLLAGKLADLSVLYQALNETRGEKIAAEEVLTLLDQRLPDSGFARGAVIAMDHYTGFTPVQRKILAKLMKQASEITISLLLPEEADQEDEIRESDLFFLSRQTCAQIGALAREQGIKVTREYLAESEDFSLREDKCYLAEHFLRYKRHLPFQATPSGIRAVISRDPKAEAEYAAGMIRKLTREQGIRYREMAVICGDLTEYRPVLSRAFEKHGIPFFMDRRSGLMGNSLVEYVRSALLVQERNFSYESIFRHLKSGVRVLETEELDKLDNYCLACGIRGKRRWQESWERIPAPRKPVDLEALNEAREKVMADLSPLLALSGQVDIKSRTQALRHMLEAVSAREQMQELAEISLKMGDREMAEENERVLDYLLEFFDQLDALMGDEKPEAQEFAEILDSGLAEARLGMIPTGLDQVPVGDVRRSRLTNIKVLFILGLNDGLIPGKTPEGGILTELEREILLESNMELAPTAESAAGQERFYLYQLVTRPSEKLFLSLSRMGQDGSARRASWLMTQLMDLFPEMEITDTDLLPAEDILCGREAAWDLAAEGIRYAKLSEADDDRCGQALPSEKDQYSPAFFREMLRSLAAEDEDRERMERLIDAAFRVYRGTAIDQEVAEALYGPEITGSVTRLEKFAECAAAQFLAFGLKLTERKTAEFTPAGRGSFFHKVLEAFFGMLRKEGILPKDLSEEKRKELVGKALQAAGADEGLSLMRDENAGSRFLYRQMEELADRAVWSLCLQLSDSQFLPEQFELRFEGFTTEALSAKVGRDMRMILRGSVDRLDACETCDARYVRIIDYKTGSKKLDLSDIWQGLSLQLPVYLDAVMEMQKKKYPEKAIVPAGMFYCHIADAFIEEKYAGSEEKRQQALISTMGLSGITNGALQVADLQEKVSGDKISAEQFGQLIRHTRKTLKEYGAAIAGGEIAVRPYKNSKKTSCDYCPFAAACGFDPLISGYSFRKIPKLKACDIWEKLAAEDDDQKGGE